MKIFLAVLVFLCFVCVGLILFLNTRKKFLFYKNFSEFLSTLETEIGFFQNDIESIINKKQYSNDFSDLLENFSKDKTLTVWETKILTHQEKEEVTNFFKKIGRADSVSQTNEIKGFENIIRRKIEEIKSVELKKAKMYLSLSFMLGLLVFVIII